MRFASTRKLVYGSFGIIEGGIAVKGSSDSNPFTASSTFVASLTVRQCTPARSPGFRCPGPPSIMMPLLGSTRTTLFRDAGPWHEAELCSQMAHVTRFAATDTPDPLLVPLGTRSVSYGLHG